MNNGNYLTMHTSTFEIENLNILFFQIITVQRTKRKMEYTNRVDFENRLYELEKKFYYFHYIGPTGGMSIETTTWFETKLYYKETEEVTLFISPSNDVQYSVNMGGVERRVKTSYMHLGTFISMLFDTLSNDSNIYDFMHKSRKNLSIK